MFPHTVSPYPAQHPPPGPPPRGRRGWYALGLLVLAPFIAETVASSNTPAVLFPIVLPLFAVIYGCPALLMRELWVRGRLTLGRLLLLGVAYTAFNEGLVAATWFKLSPTTGKVLAFTAAQAGHAGGVNWAVAANLVVFHTVFSLIVPVILMQSVATARRADLVARPWLGRIGVSVCLALIVLVVLGSLTPKATTRVCAGPARATCAGGRGVSALFIVVVIVLLATVPVLGHRRRARVRQGLPQGSQQPWSRPQRPDGGAPLAPRPQGGWVITAGVLFAVAFFVSHFAFPLAGLPGISVLTALLLFGLVAGALAKWAPRLCWNTRTGIDFCTGALAVGIVTSLRAWAFGQPVAAALAVALLVWLRRRVPAAGRKANR